MELFTWLGQGIVSPTPGSSETLVPEAGAGRGGGRSIHGTIVGCQLQLGSQAWRIMAGLDWSPGVWVRKCIWLLVTRVLKSFAQRKNGNKYSSIEVATPQRGQVPSLPSALPSCLHLHNDPLVQHDLEPWRRKGRMETAPISRALREPHRILLLASHD